MVNEHSRVQIGCPILMRALGLTDISRLRDFSSLTDILKLTVVVGVSRACSGRHLVVAMALWVKSDFSRWDPGQEVVKHDGRE